MAQFSGYPRSQRDDYHLLSREQQVVLVRLRTGHNRLNSHMHSKLKLASSPTCPCGQKDQTTDHLLQRCPPSPPPPPPPSPAHPPCPLQSYKRRRVAYQHFPDDQTLRLQAGAGEDDIIHLQSGLDRVDCERQEEEVDIHTEALGTGGDNEADCGLCLIHQIKNLAWPRTQKKKEKKIGFPSLGADVLQPDYHGGH